MEPLWTHIAKLNGNSTTSTSDAYKPESDCHNKNTTSIPVVIAAAKEAETVVLVLGGDCHEGEGTDRDFLHLPVKVFVSRCRCLDPQSLVDL